MNLKDFLASRDGKNGDFYWGLVIEKGWIQAGIWQIIAEKAEVVSISPPAAWETDEELVGASDAALSAAIQNFPEDVSEPSKTVFGVPTSWVSEGQIKKERLEAIRKICAELSLEPTGFVVLPEAIANYYKSQEGSPLNAIVLGVGDEELELAVFKLGNLVGTSVIARSVSVADDVIEGLARFSSAESLPSRILLYDGKEGELEDVRQSLLDTSWEENDKVKFLHTPKIDIIGSDKKVLAVCLAGASEIGQVSQVEEAKTPGEEEIPAEVENVEKPEAEISAQDLGFVVGEDVATREPIQKETQVPTSTPQQEVSSPGFPSKPFFQKIVPAGLVGKIKLGIRSLLSKVKKPAGVGFGGYPVPGKRVWTLGGIIFLLVLVFGFVWWWFFPKATVTIYVSPRKLEENITLLVDSAASSPDLAEKVLPGEVMETEVSSEKTKSTTGSKKVGEKAKGSVKIQNGTASNISLTVGTLLVSSGDLRFSVDKAASVSAAISPSSPGTATVEVTAADIGADYNLAKDESFKVGNYPKADVDAVALANFSGGSSRDISAVSEDDQDSLEEELKDELLEQAKEKLVGDVGSERFFIQGSVTAEVSSRTFSHKVGDEASSLKLSLTLSVKGVSVARKELYDLAREVLKDKVASGYAFRDDQIDTDFELVTEEEGKYELEGGIVVNLLPEVKPEEVAKKVAGRFPTVAENYLASIPGFTRAEIKLKPRLPGKLGTLPRLSKNISIEVTAER